MASTIDKRRTTSQRARAQCLGLVVSAAVLLCGGYLLGRAAAARSAPAHLDARSHSADRTAAAPLGTASNVTAAHSINGLHSGGRELQQIGIAVAVSARPEHVLQLLSMLLPSWQMLRSRPESRGVVLDLLIFCEGASCQELPPECRPMRSPGGRIFAHDEVSNCWFVEQDAEAVARWSDYLFMTSIQFLVQREMVEIAPRYHRILRTDEDVFLTPRLLTWRAPHDAVFGEAGYRDAFNQERLPQVAAKYGLKHRGVTDIESTWLAPPQLVLDIANLTLAVGRSLLDNEWDMTLPGLAEQAGKPGWSEKGKWPEWWKGVVSLYAAELAINHLLPDLQQSHVSPEIAEWSISDSSIGKVVHIHCAQSDEAFSKWKFRDSLLATPGRVPSAERRATYTEQRLALISDGMPVQHYASSVAQQAVRTAAAVAQFTTA